jgi:hypothetical protein
MSLKEEFAGVDLGDERLNKRLVELASCFERRHGGGVLLSCPTWKEAKAAYRFFDNGRFDEQAIMAPHCACTAKRVNQLKEPVLVIHDTTEFNYTHHTKTEGLGYMAKISRASTPDADVYTQGFFMHTSLACTTDGIPLGILNNKQWARDISNVRKVRGSGRSHGRVPVKEKESYKWLEGIEAACNGVACRDNLVHVCDRDADMYELFDNCRALGTHFVVRAVHSRCTTRKGVKCYSRLSRIAAQGRYTLTITSSQKRAARKASILVKFYTVTLLPPVDKASLYKPIELTVVSAKERKTKGVSEKDRVNWKLLTNVPVETYEQAVERIHWYCLFLSDSPLIIINHSPLTNSCSTIFSF